MLNMTGHGISGGLPLDANIKVIRCHSLPVMWEFHKNSGKVYVVQVVEGRKVQNGDLIASDVKDEHEAAQIARAWRHGYATRDRQEQE